MQVNSQQSLTVKCISVFTLTNFFRKKLTRKFSKTIRKVSIISQYFNTGTGRQPAPRRRTNSVTGIFFFKNSMKQKTARRFKN